MRVLIAAPDAYSREALVRAVGGDSIATGLEYLPNAVRSLRPDVLVLDAGGDRESTREALERARGAAESALPTVLLLSPNAAWLRGRLPAELQPSIVLARGPDRAALCEAIARLAGEPLSAAAPRPTRQAEVRWLDDRRELTGPRGRVRLTASESCIFDAVYRANGAVVSPERLASALWGQPLDDAPSRAAIRSHVYTLRKKLHEAGLGHVLVALAGSGYRLQPPGAGDQP